MPRTIKCTFSIVNNVRCYDNGGKSFDRYTVVYMSQPESHTTYSARAMSEKPFNAQGFGQMTSATPGIRLGRRIEFKTLPIDCQKLVKQDLGLRG